MIEWAYPPLTYKFLEKSFCLESRDGTLHDTHS